MNYRLTIYPSMDVANTWKVFLFETESELRAAYHTTADLLLFMQDQAKIMDDHSNMFIAEQLIDGDWEDIEI